jgi:ribosomal protein S20
LAKTPRTWTGARSPSGLKRVRQSEARHAVLQPRRSVAKTLVAKALRISAQPTDGADPTVALTEALSALDRAAKAGAIHPNAAARRKSRLTRHVNAALGGVRQETAAHVAKATSKAQAAKAAKARIAASKADKAKGAQTAAGKARAALTKTTRTEGAAASAAPAEASKPATKAKAASTKARATSASAKGTTKKPAAKKAPSKKAPAKG